MRKAKGLIMNKKPTFFTSDWHLGHENCLRFDNRPFKDIKEMHEVLIKRYNATVPESGICYFLGDIGNKTEDIKNVLAQLNGTKVLLWGNHDKGINTMYNVGFDVVLFSATLLIHKTIVSISHCPLRGIPREDLSHIKNNPVDENWHGESRKKHQMCTVTNEGQFHLHGHIHSRKDKRTSFKILDKQMDVGVTANNYTPVSICKIESWISKYKENNGE